MSNCSPKHEHYERKVGAWGLALLTFFNVSGGCFGSEPVVSSAGPLPGMICLVCMALFWGLPICLVTSEMSAALPSNGGYVLWVDTAFGAFWGFQESFWSWGSCVVDNALYPVIAYETFIAIYQGDVSHPLDSESLEAAQSWWIAYFSKLVLTVLFSLPVLIGRIEWFTHGMGVMVVLLVVPFVIMLSYILMTKNMDWTQLLQSRPNLFSNPSIDWVGLIHITFWNFNGFDCASTCAGEVKDPGRSYPRGLLNALVVIVLMTAVPLIIATAANDPPWQDWDVGWWSAIANQSAGIGFAWAIVFSSIIGAFGMHAAVMWEDAWQLCGMAEQGLAPSWFAGRNEKLGTPQNATLFSMFMVMFLIMFDFRSMVVIDNFFSVASGLLEIAAFARLKRARSDLHRPYVIPGVYDDFTLFLFLVAPVAVGVFVLLSSFNDGWSSFFTLIPFLLIGFVLPSVFRSSHMKRLLAHKKLNSRGVSFEETKELLPSVGGVYGALHLQNNTISPSPMIHPVTSKNSAESLIRLSVSADSLEEQIPLPPEGEDHIFVDHSVRFGSIFTEPKHLYHEEEDDEYLSGVEREELFEAQKRFHDDNEEEEERDHTSYYDHDIEMQMRRLRNRHRYFQDEDRFSADYIEGTDEERSYDDFGSLD